MQGLSAGQLLPNELVRGDVVRFDGTLCDVLSVTRIGASAWPKSFRVSVRPRSGAAAGQVVSRVVRAATKVSVSQLTGRPAVSDSAVTVPSGAFVAVRS
jgi:hypothetical protein